MNQGISINRTDNANEIRLDITDGSRKGILHLYHKNGGNYSNTEQGDWVNIAEACWSYLLTKVWNVIGALYPTFYSKFGESRF